MTHKRNRKRKNSPSGLERQILKIFRNDATLVLGYKAISKKIGKKSIGKEEIVEATNKLWNTGKLDKTKNNRFSLNADKINPNRNRNTASHGKIIEGIVDMTKSGDAFIVSSELEQDPFVRGSKLNFAFDGDRVKVKLTKRKNSKRMEGSVIEILERKQTEFVGIIKVSRKYAFVLPDNNKLNMDLFVPLSKIKKAKDGEKVLVAITKWPEHKRKPEAKVIEVLGKPGSNDVEMKSIVADSGFPLSFSKTVLDEAEKLTIEVDKAEIAKRRDFRKVATFTIDPRDAKDFDDALSFKKLDNGNFEIGIHIADVAHYVQPGTEMDEAGYKRATSVYLVDRVLPMFPENLSNRVCSLRPHEEKLCFSAVFEITENAEVLHEWFGRTVIYSDRRFTYSEAQHVLDTREGDFAEELYIMNEIAKKFRKKRFEQGSINFGSSEVRFELDEMGKPIGVKVKEIMESNQLIEDFMLLANRKVAKFINTRKFPEKSPPSVNRVHATPNIEKLEELRRIAGVFGHKLEIDTPQQIASSLNTLLLGVQGQPEQQLLETLAIRCMAKAAYSTDNIGHYGLGFKHYMHFTSPIRRYPDVMTHRILAKCLEANPKINWDASKLEKKCEHCSVMERKAISAERESVKYKQVEFLSERLGEVFDGVISGIKGFGFFVELADNKCEGLVSINSLVDDYYHFDEASYAIIGNHKKKKYQLGDKVKVQIVKTDLGMRTVDMEVV